jgi:hypothetical protein
MSETNLQKIDKYYLGLTFVLVLMAVLLVFSFKGIFSAFLTAGSFDSIAIEGQIRVNQTELDTAHTWAFNKNPESLQVVQ